MPTQSRAQCVTNRHAGKITGQYHRRRMHGVPKQRPQLTRPRNFNRSAPQLPTKRKSNLRQRHSSDSWLKDFLLSFWGIERLRSMELCHRLLTGYALPINLSNCLIVFVLATSALVSPARRACLMPNRISSNP